jgi:hypothetical protein
LRIGDAPETYKEFSDHDFIKSVIRLEEEWSEEKASTQKTRKGNGLHA